MYTDRDGLPTNSVNDACFDSAGFLWIATEDGAARYDGRKWVVHPMPNRLRGNNVRSIVGSRDGSMHFGTLGGGLIRYSNGQFEVIGVEDGLPDGFVLCIHERVDRRGQTELWAGTRKGLVRWSDKGMEVLTTSDGLPDNVVVAITQCKGDDGEDELWFATQNGLARLANGSWTIYRERDGMPSSSVLSVVGIPAADGTRVLWAGTASSGLARFHRGIWTTFTDDDGLPALRIRSLAPVAGSDGLSVWVGTSGGLSKITGDRVVNLRKSLGLGTICVNCIMTGQHGGPDGFLWIATDGGGLARFRFGKWISFPRTTGLEATPVSAYCEARVDDGPGSMWVAGADGLRVFDGQGWTNRTELVPSISTEVVAVKTERLPDGRDAIWYAMSVGGIARYDGESVAILDKEHGYPTHSTYSLRVINKEDAAATVWAATDVGLVSITGSQLELYDRSAGLPHYVVKQIILESDRSGDFSMWVATDEGLCRITPSAIRIWNAGTGVQANNLADLCISRRIDGTRVMWVGTNSGGLAYFDPDAEDLKWHALSSMTTPALPNDDIVGLVADRQNRIYALTNKGVARITLLCRNPDGSDHISIEVFTSDDGLPSSECNARSGYLDSRGRVWIGTVAGAAVLDPEAETFDRSPSPLRITQAHQLKSGRELRQGHVLVHNENDVVFEYALLFYYREADSRFRTQLIGFDDRPSEWTSEAKRSYTNLPAGNYVFRVWARDYAGNISGPVDHEFRIKVAPWRTWWAYAGYASAAGAATYGGVRWRLHQLRLRNEMLEATIREQTADLAAKVDQLRYSEMTTREKADELALAVDQLRVLEQKAQKARLEAVGAKDRALEASRAKSEFLSNMSHELRTPLNAVIGFAQLLERDPDLNREQREHLTAILSSGEHLLHLINDVLSLSKIEAGKMSLTIAQFDLHRTLEGVEAMLRGRTRTKGLQLTVVRDPDVPRFVLGDEGKLRQIMINLLGNAVKFTDAGSITLRAAWQDGIGIFDVEDTGHGIAEEELENLFEAFVQTESGRKSKEGTGLGLAISRNFVQMMGGDMRVRSTLGKGTTFSFDAELAAVTEGGDRIETRRIVALEAGQPEFRILVVDDVERNRTVLVKLLEAVGFVVDEAADGREAVAKWSSWRPDLVLMDKRMPVMDGLAATREIRRLEAEFEDAALPEFEGAPVPPVGRTVIISLSASAFEHEHAEILGAGSDEIITKPFRHERLFEALSRHLGARFESYLDDEDLEASIAPSEAPSPDRLRDLPSEWVASLVEAVVRGDVEQCVTIVDRIGERDEELASHLRTLVRSYRFDDIQLLIEESLSA
ncbi:MAG: response regulator [Blastocatellia bacterium]|nr:response regulator [Blastocatellia bacterium]